MYLIAGGPSLETFPWEKLQGERCIAITRSFEKVPWAEILYFTDGRFWDWYHANLVNWKGRIITAVKPERIHPKRKMEHYRLSGAKGLDLQPGRLRHGNNSGYAAINLAIHEGHRELYLLGYDMRFRDGRSHFHKGHPVKNNPSTCDKMLPFFATLKKPLQKLGARVWNACPDSRIDVFPKIPWEELPCW